MTKFWGINPLKYAVNSSSFEMRRHCLDSCLWQIELYYYYRIGQWLWCDKHWLRDSKDIDIIGGLGCGGFEIGLKR